LQRRRAETQKPPAARWIIGLAVALVPVLLLLGSVDGFLRVFHRINSMYENMPAPTPVPAAEEFVESEPGVVMLRPMDEASRAPVAPAKK